MIIDLDYEVVKMPIDGWLRTYFSFLKMSYKIFTTRRRLKLMNFSCVIQTQNWVIRKAWIFDLLSAACILILTKPQPQFMWMTRANKASYHVFFEGWTEKTKNMEIGSDGRPVWRQDHRPGQTLDFLWELGMESLQVKTDILKYLI